MSRESSRIFEDESELFEGLGYSEEIAHCDGAQQKRI